MKKILGAILVLFSASLIFAQTAESADNENSETKIENSSNSKDEKTVHFGAGLTPGLTDLGFCNFFDKTASTLGAAGSIKTPFYYGGIGSGFGLNGSYFTADTFHQFTPGELFEFTTFDYMTFNYKNKCRPDNFYTGNVAKIKPFAKDSFFKSIYATGEYLTTGQFEMIDFISTVGLETYLPSNNYSYLLVEPYAFLSGYEFNDLSLGMGLDFKSCIIFAKYIGFEQNFATRYAFVNFGGNSPYTHLSVEDYFRGQKRNEWEKAQLTFSSATELFFNTPDFNWTLLNFLTFIQIQVGGFFTTSYNNEWAWSTGGLSRFRVSMGGGNPFFGELGYGYNSVTSKGFFIIGLATAY